MSEQSQKGLTWPLSAIKVRPEQIRKHLTETGLNRLAASIRDNGLLQPLVIDELGWLLAGHSRLEAVKRLGWESVPVRILEGNLDETEILLLQWAENEDREGLTAYDQWQAVEFLKQRHPQWTNRQIAEHLHVDPSMIPRFESPGKCIKAAQDALKAGQLGISHIYCLSKHEPAEQERLLALKFGGTGRDALELEGRKPQKTRNGSPKPQERQTRWNIPLPGGISVSVAGKDLSFDKALAALTETVKECEKAKDKGLSGVNWVAAMKDKAKGGK
jgi:ParB family transcriptional regulator, chromosome partitioning protein